MPVGVYFRTIETRLKISKALKGENCPHWKGGIKERKKRYREKHKNDLKYKLNHRISLGIWCSMKKGIKNGRTWQSLVGYTYKQLKKYLKSTIPKGYYWNDFLNGKLQIDHIIPISAFNFEKPEDLQFKQCWALKNLQLLTAEENRKKWNKLIKPFQKKLEI